MNYKLIALDIDGTLINSSHQLTDGVKKAIKKAKERGVKVVLCTGRPLKGVEQFLDELNLKEEGDYAATFNGALVQDTFTKNPVSHLTLKYEDLVDLYNLSLEVGSRSHFYDTKTLYTFNRDISDYTVLESHLTGTHTPKLPGRTKMLSPPGCPRCTPECFYSDFPGSAGRYSPPP